MGWSPARRRDIVLRLLRGESVEAVSREVAVPIAVLERWRQRFTAACFLGLHRPAELVWDFLRLISRIVNGLWWSMTTHLKRIKWSVLVQTLAVVASAVFAGLLFSVTRDYTQLTERIFSSQQEKYIYEVLGNHAFELEIFPTTPIRRLDKPQLQVRLKNLTGLGFTRVRIEVFAEVNDRRRGKRRTMLVFDPSARLIGMRLEEGGILVVQDTQNDVAFQLREYGVLTEGSAVKAGFDLLRFWGRVEALSPGGVLWRLRQEAPR